MQIDSNFECGNIVVESTTETEANLSIRADSKAKYYQWFYFRVTAQTGRIHILNIRNAGGASYPRAWGGYRALASYDEVSWFRVHTQYDGTNLTIKHRPSQEVTAYAFFVPYTEPMRERLLTECAASPLAERQTIVTTPGGRPVERIRVGGAQAKKRVWIISRLHAGEPMAEYCIEGMMRQMLDPNDPVAKSLLAKNVSFSFIPNMNPDGSALGNLRANAAGVDLNRVWDNPPETAPEISSVRALMEQEGCDFFMDLHGDEERPYIWLVQPLPENMTPDLEPAQQYFEAEVRAQWAEYGVSPDNIPTTTPEPPAYGMSLDYTAKRFKCPSFIVELPFRDILGPDGEVDSLQPEGCAAFGRTCLEIIDQML